MLDCESLSALLKLAKCPSFSFLNDIDRIASSLYLPSDDDIVRSRLRTVGIQEYHIFVPGDNCKSNHSLSIFLITPCLYLVLGPKREWILYDVGGSRTMVGLFSC